MSSFSGHSVHPSEDEDFSDASNLSDNADEEDAQSAHNTHSNTPCSSDALSDLWDRLMQPQPMQSGNMCDESTYTDLSVEQIGSLLQQMHADLCVGSLDPIERMFRVLDLDVGDADSSVSLRTMLLAAATEHMTPMNMDAIAQRFTVLGKRLVALRNALIALDFQNAQGVDLKDVYQCAQAIQQIAARLYDLRQHYVYGAASFRENVSTIGYDEFIRTQSATRLFDRILCAEHITGQLLNERYLEAVAASDSDALYAPPGVNAIITQELVDPLTRTINEMETMHNSMTERNVQRGSGAQQSNGSDDEAESQHIMSDIVSELGLGFGGGGDDMMSSASKRRRGTGGSRAGQRADSAQAQQDIGAMVIKKACLKLMNTRVNIIYHHILSLINHHGLRMRISMCSGAAVGSAAAGIRVALGGLSGTRFIMQPRFTRNGVFSRCYASMKDSRGVLMDIAMLVSGNMFNSQINQSLYTLCEPTNPVPIAKVVMALSKPDPLFPLHSCNRNLVSFEDGVVHMPSMCFYSFHDIATLSPSCNTLSARKRWIAFLGKTYTQQQPHGALHIMSSEALRDALIEKHCKELALIQTSHSCAFVDREMKHVYTDGFLARFEHRVEREVLDVLYPLMDGDTGNPLEFPPRVRDSTDELRCPCCEHLPRIRHPQGHSSKEVFDKYIDLVTDIFRQCVEHEPTILDSVFGLQLGLDTNPCDAQRYMRAMAPQTHPVSRECNIAVQRMHDAVKLHAERRSKQQQPAVTLEPFVNQQHTVTAADFEDPTTDVITIVARCDEIARKLEWMSLNTQPQYCAMRPDTIDALAHVRAAMEVLSSSSRAAAAAFSQQQSEQWEGVEECAEGAEHERGTHAAAQQEEEEDVYAAMAAEDEGMANLVENDLHSMAHTLTAAQVARFATPEHHAFRALMLIYSVLGTYFVERHSVHDRAFILWLCGQSGTGKTRVILQLFKMVYGKEHIGIINNNMEEQFGLAPILDEEYYVAVGNEITPDTSFPFATYLTLITEEDVRTPVKHQDSREVRTTSKLLMASNRLVSKWGDPGASGNDPGAFCRRTLVAFFTNPPLYPLSDSEFDARMMSQMAVILARIMACRRFLIPVFTIQTFWRHGSPLFDVWRRMVSSSLRPFDKMIASGIFEFHPSYIISELDLHTIVEHFCRHNRITQKSVTWEDLMAFLLARGDVSVVENQSFLYRQFKSVDVQFLQTRFIRGMRFTAAALLMYGYQNATSMDLTANIVSGGARQSAVTVAAATLFAGVRGGRGGRGAGRGAAGRGAAGGVSGRGARGGRGGAASAGVAGGVGSANLWTELGL